MCADEKLEFERVNVSCVALVKLEVGVSNFFANEKYLDWLWPVYQVRTC